MRFARIVVLVTLALAVVAAPASAAQRRYFGTTVTVGVGGGSTLTFEAPGKQAGTLVVGGYAPGFIRGKFALNTDYMVRLGENQAAALALGDVPGGRAGTAIDGPLIDSCENNGFRTAVGPKSRLTFLRTGAVTGKLVLTIFNADVGFGCTDIGSQRVTIPVTGQLGIKKLARLVLDGQAAGVNLPGGVVGSVRLHLVTHLRLTD